MCIKLVRTHYNTHVTIYTSNFIYNFVRNKSNKISVLNIIFRHLIHFVSCFHFIMRCSVFSFNYSYNILHTMLRYCGWCRRFVDSYEIDVIGSRPEVFKISITQNMKYFISFYKMAVLMFIHIRCKCWLFEKQSRYRFLSICTRSVVLYLWILPVNYLVCSDVLCY